MIFLERNDIDIEKWDKTIADNAIENVFCYSWYLDSVCQNWAAFVSQDYKTVIPLPYTRKLGVKRLYQAPFTREYDIFGNQFNWNTILPPLSEKFKALDFRTSIELQLNDKSVRKHQQIDLSSNYEDNYRSNAKRLIKKGQKKYHFRSSNEPKLLIDLFKNTVAHKIDSIGQNELDALIQLMEQSLKRERAEMIAAFDENNAFVAGGFFLKDKQRITYLKGAAGEAEKKQGVMYALFHFAFQRFQNDYVIFDFGGSSIEGVATFYKKFGAIDRKYYNYTIDNTPLWFKLLKRIKK